MSRHSSPTKSPCGAVHALWQEVPVSLVDHEINAALAAELRETLDHMRRVDGPGRVVGRHQDDGAHLVVDQRLRVLDARHESGIRPAGQRARLDAEHVEAHLVVEIPGRRQQHRVAAMGEQHHRHEEGHVAARRDRRVLRSDPALVDPGKLGRIGLPERRIAVDRPVLRARGIAGDGGHSLEQLGMGRIARNGLGQVDQRPEGAVIALRPGLRLRDRRAADIRDEGIDGFFRTARHENVRLRDMRKGRNPARLHRNLLPCKVCCGSTSS